MTKKLVHNEEVLFTSDYIDKDLVKYKFINNRSKSEEIRYSRIIKVKPHINDKYVLKLSYIMENSDHVQYEDIVCIEKKYYS